ncbi:LytR/AlgR family response regulator transcription factor [Tellurirhabdus rosea]|uniref:LytR/AlgR family response regulator transcription factor n=1 Tax=Tellurirhabdus rosea TaxID=2674997 RepID=UPI002252DEB5|nr:LytTR family DNA-binding domain-containing protein [Tellurirhabdus rosea]
MQVFLVEDEELAVRKLSKLLQEVAPDVQVVGTAASVRASVAWLESNPTPDLILMDIELADGQSFEIFEQTTVSSPVIFTTSYDEYALKAFKVNSIDYLLKPIRRNELEASLEKYQRLHAAGVDAAANGGVPEMATAAIDALVQQLRQQTQPVDYRRRFLVKHRQQWVPIEVSDIAYYFTEDGVSLFKTFGGQKYSLDYTLDDLEKMLDPTQFFRANRQFIIHIHSVQQIHTYFNNKLKLQLKPAPDDEVIISREKASDFKKWMGK